MRLHRKVKPTPNPRKHIPLENFYRPRVEGGVREDDPPEVKRDYANYVKKRKEGEKWEIPLTDEQLSTLDNLASKDFDQYQDKLAEIVESWAKQHPELALEIFQPKAGKRKWLADMGFVSQKDLEMPILPQYPFETHFLTVNIFAKLYGLSPLVVDAILLRISEVRAGEAVAPSEEKNQKGKRTEWRTQSERIEARKAEEAEQEDLEEDTHGKHLFHAAILSEQYDKLVEAIGTLSRQAARKILNLEVYLHVCLRNAHKRPKHREEKSWFRISDLTSEQLEKDLPPNLITPLTPEQILTSKDAWERMVEWREKVRAANSFSQRQRDILVMKETGSFTLQEIADQIGVHIATVKRELRSLRLDSSLQELHKQYEEISDDIGEVAAYCNPQRRKEGDPNSCLACRIVFNRTDEIEECPACHSPMS